MLNVAMILFFDIPNKLWTWLNLVMERYNVSFTLYGSVMVSVCREYDVGYNLLCFIEVANFVTKKW